MMIRAPPAPGDMAVLALLVTALLQASRADSLTLAEAINRARLYRGQVTAAGARVAAARAVLRAAGTIPNPTVSYSYTESPPRQHLSVDQPFDWLLRRGPDRAAARAGVERARADSAELVTSLAQEVRVAFYRARAALDSELLVQRQVMLADSLGRLAVARFQAGDISLFEREQAAQEGARARQALSEARERSQVELGNLARAVGWNLQLPPWPAGALDTALDRPAPGPLVADSVPALKLAVADSIAAWATARAAGRARVPLPSVQTGAEWDDPASSNRALALIGISLPLPLWHSGGAQAAQSRAQAMEAAARTLEARLEVRRLLREAVVHLEETARRARFARDSVLPAAATLRDRALRAYQSGETGVLPVLDAIRSQSDAELAAIQDLLTYQEARAAVYALLGRPD